MAFDPQIIFFAIFGLVVANFLFKILKNGGLRAALFGAKIDKTVGEVSVAGKKLFKSTLKVHAMRGESDRKLIGIEFVQKSIASYQMLPITLSLEESKLLITLLQAAVENEDFI